MRRLGLVMAFLLVLPVLAVSVDAQQIERRQLDLEERRIVLYALAVGQRSDGSTFGVAPPLEVTMRTGSGSVLVETEPLTQIDMQGSARLAVTVASSITRVDARGWDFLFYMRSGSPVVGGPSAGGVMTVAAVALLMGWDLRNDVAMTGMINPDGTIGPVGGILEKMQAAADRNANVFLVPEGQTTIVRTVQEVQQDGPFQQVVQRRETVDAVAAGRQLGLEVREVRDIYQAVEAFTGYRLERRVAEGSVASEAYTAIMGPAAATQHQEAAGYLRALEQRAAGSSLDASLRGEVETLLSDGRDRVEEAGQRYGNGSYYSTSSLVFQARLKLRLAEYLMDADAAGAPGDVFRDHADAATQEAEGLTSVLGDYQARTLSGLSALGAAQDRLLEAQALAAQAEETAVGGQMGAALERLAFAAERLGTADWWFSLAQTLDEPQRQQRAFSGSVRDLASSSLSSAVQAVTYAGVILQESGVQGVPAEVLAEGQQSLTRAEEALTEGFEEAATFLSLEAQVAAFTSLSLLGANQNLTGRLDDARNRALVEVGDARQAGVEPVVAVSLLDFGDTLRTDTPTQALLFYAQSATVARAGILLVDAPPGRTAATFVGPGFLERINLVPLVSVAALGALAGFAVGAFYAATRPAPPPAPARLQRAPQPVHRPGGPAQQAARATVEVRHRPALPPAGRPRRASSRPPTSSPPRAPLRPPASSRR